MSFMANIYKENAATVKRGHIESAPRTHGTQLWSLILFRENAIITQFPDDKSLQLATCDLKWELNCVCGG